jgi:hypothetical protein
LRTSQAIARHPGLRHFRQPAIRCGNLSMRFEGERDVVFEPNRGKAGRNQDVTGPTLASFGGPTVLDAVVAARTGQVNRLRPAM